MRDTLGGSHIAVKAHLQDNAVIWPVTTPVAYCYGQW